MRRSTAPLKVDFDPLCKHSWLEPWSPGIKTKKGLILYQLIIVPFFFSFNFVVFAYTTPIRKIIKEHFSVLTAKPIIFLFSASIKRHISPLQNQNGWGLENFQWFQVVTKLTFLQKLNGLRKRPNRNCMKIT